MCGRAHVQICTYVAVCKIEVIDDMRACPSESPLSLELLSILTLSPQAVGFLRWMHAAVGLLVLVDISVVLFACFQEATHQKGKKNEGMRAVTVVEDYVLYTWT